MRNNLQQWFDREGERFLAGIGLRPNDTVLDFGCGEGVYSIPAAALVGEGGAVFALDRSRHYLNHIIEKSAEMGLSNIATVQNLDELKRTLHGSLLDVALFYDVIHSYYFTAIERTRLFLSIRPMMRAGGIVSIFPRHMNRGEIRTVTSELRNLGFFPQGEKSTKLMHDGNYISGYTIQAKKGKGAHDAENKTV